MLTKDYLIDMAKQSPLGKKFMKYNNRVKILWFSLGLLTGLALGYTLGYLSHKLHRDETGSKPS
jgi:hypothetical protein